MHAPFFFLNTDLKMLCYHITPFINNNRAILTPKFNTTICASFTGNIIQGKEIGFNLLRDPGFKEMESIKKINKAGRSLYILDTEAPSRCRYNMYNMAVLYKTSNELSVRIYIIVSTRHKVRIPLVQQFGYISPLFI